MLTKKLLTIVGGVILPVALTVTLIGFSANNKNVAKLFAEGEDTEYTLTFDSNSIKGSYSYNSDSYDYAYSNSTLGNKYGLVGKNTTGESRGTSDVAILKGTSNFIYFSYGNINIANNTYEEAAFPGKVKSVTMNCYYTAPTDYNLYVRVYYSSDGAYSDTYRKGYTVTKELSTITFDLSSVAIDPNYIKIGISNGFSIYHFESISITYGC